MRTVAIIQARLGSSRLKAKVLADIGGRPMLQHVIERAQQIKGVDGVAVAYPVSGGDDALGDAVLAWSKVGSSAGPPLRLHAVSAEVIAESDVLGRFALVANDWHADVCLRITADCPLLDPAIASLVLQRFHEEHADFASNDVTESGYADGLDTEVFTRALLTRAHAEATSAYDREHVTPIMKRLPGVRVVLVKNGQPVSTEKWSVDSVSDLERVREIIRNGGRNSEKASVVGGNQTKDR